MTLLLSSRSMATFNLAAFIHLPPNTKDVHLALLVREIGAITVNIPLSLNSYKSKRRAYITFKSQRMMDTAMEQSITLQGHMLQWELPKNTNKLCYKYGKLGCAPSACPMNNSRGRSRTRNPVAHLKERFNIGQRNDTSSANRSRQRSRSQSKDHFSSHQRNNSNNNAGRNVNASSSNPNNPTNHNKSAQRLRSNERKGKECSVSFSTSQRNNTVASNPNEDMASVRARVHALELADQKMSGLEERVFGHKQDDVSARTRTILIQLTFEDI
ncbi:unnamed protein product [Rhizophagus irregularis]|nr:unnamed protein product [Rhizophagus irregularis]